jgi:outer membrane immunogenic protein
MQFKSRLTAISISSVATSLLLATSLSFAANYKGEGSLKAVEASPQPIAVLPVVESHNTGLKDGFYVGVAGGYDSYRVRRSASFTSNSYAFSSNPTANANGLTAGLFAGVGKYFDKMYLGGEVTANTSNVNQTQNSTTSAIGVDTSYINRTKVGATYSVDLIPGIKVNDSSLVYARVGFARANIKNTETAIVNGANSTDRNNKWQSGMKYGIGVETALNPNLSLRGEFNHAEYNSYKTGFGTKVSPSNNQFLLGLSFHFA